jgi:SAM-dependent methyltransferase
LGQLPSDLAGPFDVAVSARAIHHLPPENKRRLYRAIFEVLTPGGCFFNMDPVGPRDDVLKAMYRQATDFLRGGPVERPPQQAALSSGRGHFADPVEEHLASLTAAGFAPVDCFWKHLGDALFGGYKPA